jgi:hypothetical protein
LLGRYINRAARDVGAREAELDRLRNIHQKTVFGDHEVNSAIDDKETKDNLNKANRLASQSITNKMNKIDKKGDDRRWGINTAIKKLSKRD